MAIDRLWDDICCLLGFHSWTLATTWVSRGAVYGFDRCVRCGASRGGARFLRLTHDVPTTMELQLRERSGDIRRTEPDPDPEVDLPHKPLVSHHKPPVERELEAPAMPQKTVPPPAALPPEVRATAYERLQAEGTRPQVVDTILADMIGREEPLTPRRWAITGYGPSDSWGRRGPHRPVEDSSETDRRSE